MIEKIDLSLATFENQEDANQAIADIKKGIKSSFWKWIVRILKEQENILTEAVMEDDIVPDLIEKAKAFVSISKLIRDLPEKQLKELDSNTEEEEGEEDFFGDEDPFDKK